MAKVSKEEIRKLGRLSRLRLTDNEIDSLQKDLSNILDYVEKLQSVDVSGLEPTSQVTGLMNVVRQDSELDYKTTADELLKNAPATLDRQFKVKRII